MGAALRNAARFCVIPSPAQDFAEGFSPGQVWYGGGDYNNSPGVLGACYQLIAGGKVPVLLGARSSSQAAVIYNDCCRRLTRVENVVFVEPMHNGELLCK